MTRLWLCIMFAVAGCSATETERPDTDEEYLQMEASSGTVFFIPANELNGVKQKALAGDNKQLQRLIDYYLFSHEPRDGAAEVELQKLQEIAAERKLAGAAKGLLYNANAQAGPDCPTIKKHGLSLSSKEVESLRDYNSYVDKCFAE